MSQVSVEQVLCFQYQPQVVSFERVSVEEGVVYWTWEHLDVSSVDAGGSCTTSSGDHLYM